MSIGSQIKKFSFGKLFTVIISVIGIMSGVVGLLAYFQKNSPHLVYQILANTDVFEEKENLGDLDILFRGNNLKKNNQKLVIVTIKVLNDGTANVLKNFYDSNDPLGLELSDGIFAETPSVLDAGSDYLRKNLTIKQTSERKVFFPDLIIEQGDYFTIKTLILSDKYSQPKVLPIGKVAGVKEIEVKSLYESDSTNNFSKFLRQTFFGGILIQFFRLIGYFLIGFGLIILGVFLSEFIEKKIKKLKRKRIVAMFKKSDEYKTDFTAKVLSIYIEHDSSYLKLIDKLIDSNGALQVNDHKSRNTFRLDGNIRVIESNFSVKPVISDLKESKLTVFRDGQLFIKDGFRKDLGIFLKYLLKVDIKNKYDQYASQQTFTIKSD